MKNLKVNKNKRRSHPILNKISKFVSIICIVLAIALAVQVVLLQIFPMALVIPAVAVVLLISLVLFLVLNYRTSRFMSKFLCLLLVVIVTAGYGFGNYAIFKLTYMFHEVTNLTDHIVNTVSVLSPVDSPISSLEDLDGKAIGTVPSLDEEGTKRCLKDLKRKGIDVTVYEYDKLQDLLDDMFKNHSSEGIVLSASLESAVHDLGTYDTLNTMVKKVHTTTYKTSREKQTESSLNRVKNITSDAFTILISGNDSYGTLAENSRSDVNMLVTINPKTQTVLMTSIPRDYYVPMACAIEDEQCPDGQFDKLTHTGLFGVETTDKTLEEFLGVPVNYTVRVNFSSLVNLVDSLGGVDVYVEEGNEVANFSANSSLGVEAGWNHMEGERALAYSRERHAYQDGDNQRVKNQQAVLEAMVKKITSPSMIVNFGSFVDALSSAFETNMPSDQILSFIRYQFTLNPKWHFESYSLVGVSSNEYCASLGDYAAVALGYMESIETAKEKIDAVIHGKSADDVEAKDANQLQGSSLLQSNMDSQQQNDSVPQETVPQQPEYQEPAYQPDYSYDQSYQEDMTNQVPNSTTEPSYDDSSDYDPNAEYGQ